MQRANNTSACASCKHQRKKCTEKCTLAPFFPVERTREFQAVHKVFGVSNVTKLITSLREEDQKVAVESLVWEALSRQKDPILGPLGDYRRVCEELRIYKAQYHQHFHQGSIVYKAAAAQGIMGWNNNSNKVINTNNISNNNNTNNNNTNFIGNNGNSIVDYCTYGYSPNHHNIHHDSEKQRAERENGATAIILPHQHLPNAAYSQQFILAGQYNPLDSKSMESTLWEGSS